MKYTPERRWLDHVLEGAGPFPWEPREITRRKVARAIRIIRGEWSARERRERRAQTIAADCAWHVRIRERVYREALEADALAHVTAYHRHWTEEAALALGYMWDSASLDVVDGVTRVTLRAAYPRHWPGDAKANGPRPARDAPTFVDVGIIATGAGYAEAIHRAAMKHPVYVERWMRSEGRRKLLAHLRHGAPTPLLDDHGNPGSGR